jgi:hypothetical protein
MLLPYCTDSFYFQRLSPPGLTAAAHVLSSLCNMVILATTDRGHHRHSVNDAQSAIHSVHRTLPDATEAATDPVRKKGLFRSYLRVPTNYVIPFNCQEIKQSVPVLN